MMKKISLLVLSCAILASALPLQAFKHADVDYEQEVAASQKPFWTKSKKIAVGVMIAGALAIVTPFGIYHLFFKSPSNNGTNRLQSDKGAALKPQNLGNKSQEKKKSESSNNALSTSSRQLEQSIEQRKQGVQGFDQIKQRLQEPLPEKGSFNDCKSVESSCHLLDSDLEKFNTAQQDELKQLATEREKKFNEEMGKKYKENYKKLEAVLGQNTFDAVAQAQVKDLIDNGFMSADNGLRCIMSERLGAESLEECHADKIQFLLDNGASLYSNVAARGSSQTFNEFIAKANKSEVTKVLIKWLKDKKGGIDAQQYGDGATELHNAVSNSPGVENIELLLKEGANPNAVIAQNSTRTIARSCTPLHLAMMDALRCRKRLKAVLADDAIKKIEVLRKYKADPNFTNGGTIESPLAYAKRMDAHPLIIDALTK